MTHRRFLPLWKSENSNIRDVGAAILCHGVIIHERRKQEVPALVSIAQSGEEPELPVMTFRPIFPAAIKKKTEHSRT